MVKNQYLKWIQCQERCDTEADL